MTPVTGAAVTSATVSVTVDNAVLKAQDVQAVEQRDHPAGSTPGTRSC